MSVTQFTRWKGGDRDPMVAAAKQVKPIIERHGAEFFRFARFHAGPWPGDWLAVSRYPDWETFGKAQDKLAHDAEYQKILAQVMHLAELAGRSITVGIDL